MLGPNESIGKEAAACTVVGVVTDSRESAVAPQELRSRVVQAFVPLDAALTHSAVLVHTVSDPEQLLPGIRDAAVLPVTATTLPAILTRRNAKFATLIEVVDALGDAATAVAAVGLLGLIAFTVSQRTRSIGIRMALGAQRADILRLLAAEYALPIGAGAAIALPIAFFYSVIIGGSLSISPFQPLTYVTGLGIFSVAACAAAILAASRAWRIDPAAALRHE